MLLVATMPASCFASSTRASDLHPVPTHLLSIGVVHAMPAGVGAATGVRSISLDDVVRGSRWCR